MSRFAIFFARRRFQQAMKRILVVLLSALVLFVLSAPAAAEDAAALFKAKCAMCHGADGVGKTPMGAKLNLKDLHSPEVQKQSKADLTTIIAKGKGKMPSNEGKLTKDQVDLLVGYVQSMGKK